MAEQRGDDDVAADKAVTQKTKRSEKPKQKSANPIARLLRFLREVVAELRKVIWPTRQDLIRYTIITVVFVSIIVTFVAALDYGLAKAVLYLFGDPDAGDGAG